jgi:hypothetical protein
VSTNVNADQLDATILEVLRTTPGQSMAWRELRDLLPDPGYWPRLRSLTRLVGRGLIDTWKDDRGRNYCLLAPTMPAPRPRRLAI